MKTQRNLWPDDITYTEAKAPVVLLKEQAFWLGQRTQNLVEAEVDLARGKYAEEGRFKYRFYIVAPLLGNYRSNLFTISHTVTKLYPVTIHFTQDLYTELFPDLPQTEPLVASAKDEAEFLEILKKIFDAPKTRNVIQTILAQSKGFELEWERIPSFPAHYERT
jgi:hypothetical protein